MKTKFLRHCGMFLNLLRKNNNNLLHQQRKNQPINKKFFKNNYCQSKKKTLNILSKIIVKIIILNSNFIDDNLEL